MNSYERALEYANKVLRIRDLALDGRLGAINRFEIRSHYINNDFDIRLNFAGSKKIVMYFTSTKNRDISYLGFNKVTINQTENRFGMYSKDEIYEYSTGYPTEEWYFQESLIQSNDEVLESLVLIKLLQDVRLSEYSYYFIKTEHIDEMIELVDDFLKR